MSVKENVRGMLSIIIVCDTTGAVEDMWARVSWSWRSLRARHAWRSSGGMFAMTLARGQREMSSLLYCSFGVDRGGHAGAPDDDSDVEDESGERARDEDDEEAESELERARGRRPSKGTFRECSVEDSRCGVLGGMPCLACLLGGLSEGVLVMAAMTYAASSS